MASPRRLPSNGSARIFSSNSDHPPEALRKDDTDLHGKLDKALADMKADGVAAKIAEQWFGKNILK
jgi:ABC-type amino acid transport substrate-binding protein